jgi:hypothetical protein
VKTKCAPLYPFGPEVHLVIISPVVKYRVGINILNYWQNLYTTMLTHWIRVTIQGLNGSLGISIFC